MNKFLLKMVKPFVKNRIEKLLDDPEIKELVVSKINEKMDMPNVTEEREKELLEVMYTTVEILIKDIIEEI